MKRKSNAEIKINEESTVIIPPVNNFYLVIKCKLAVASISLNFGMLPGPIP